MSPKTMTSKKFKCATCGKDYMYKGGLAAHTKRLHQSQELSKKNKDVSSNIFDGNESSGTIELLVEALVDIEVYDAGAQASQQTKYDETNEMVNVILNDIINIVETDKSTAAKTAIVPDSGWTRNTTGDLASLLNDIPVDINPFECEDCDMRFMTKEDVDEHDLTKHGIEEDRLESLNSHKDCVTQYEYDLLYRKHTKLDDRNIILTRANQMRLEISKDNERLRQANESNEETLQETLKRCQILEDAVKVRDMDIDAKEEMIKSMKEKEKTSEGAHQEQLQYIRTLEEQLGTNDEDDNEAFDGLIVADEVEAEWISLEAQRQNIPPVKCKHCNFSTNSATKMVGHMTRHNKSKCDNCQKTFEDQTKLNMHIQQEHRQDPHNCNTCKKQFPSKNSLKQHMRSQHPVNPPVGHQQWAQQKNHEESNDYWCNQCGQMFETLSEIREHKKNMHTNENFSGFQCQSQQKKKSAACTRGPQCKFLAWGTCHFFHPGVGVQQTRQQNNQQNQQNWRQQLNLQQHQNQQLLQQPRRKCHFQERCWNQNCSFEHEDFRLRTEFLENY